MVGGTNKAIKSIKTRVLAMDEIDIQRAISISADTLNYAPLKEEQRICIEAFLKGKDVFVVLPTGYGKSICYACIPTAFNAYHKKTPEDGAIIVVISPLTALIKDQVHNLANHNVDAGYIDAESKPEVKESVVKGRYSIVFMSPEMIVNKWRSLFENPLYQKRLAGIIIDEAHCVVKW